MASMIAQAGLLYRNAMVRWTHIDTIEDKAEWKWEEPWDGNVPHISGTRYSADLLSPRMKRSATIEDAFIGECPPLVLLAELAPGTS